MDALDFARLREAQHWSWIRRDDGLERLSWSGPLEEVDREALGRLFGLWHPRIVGLDRVDQSGGILSVHTRLFRASGRATTIPPDAALVLSATLETAVQGADLLLVKTLSGSVAALPSPYCWRRRREPSQSELSGRHLTPSFAFHSRTPAGLMPLLDEMLEASEWCAQALALIGPSGSGRSTLLDHLAFEAGFRGARVTRHPPRTIAASERPLVLLLDDACEVDPRAIELSLVAAERVRRRMVVVAAMTETADLSPWTSLDWRPYAVPGLEPGELCANVQTLGLVPREVVEGLAGLAAGSPARFRLLLQATLRSGKACETAPRAAAEVVASLGAGPRAALAAAASVPGGAPYDLLHPRLARDCDWDEVSPWLSVSGRRRLRPLVPELAEALMTWAELGENHPFVLANALPRSPEYAAARASLELKGGDATVAAATLLEAPPRDALGLAAAAPELGSELRQSIEMACLRLAPGRGFERAHVLEVAARAATDERLRVRLDLERTELLARLERFEETRSALERVSPDRLEPRERSRYLVMRAVVSWSRGLASEAWSDVREATRVVGPGRERADALHQLGRFLCRPSGDRRRGRAAFAAALRAYEQAGDGMGAARSRADLLAETPRQPPGAVLGAHRAVLEAATQSGDATAIGMAHAMVARDLLLVGSLRSAERHCRAALSWLGSALGPQPRAEILMVAALVRTELGSPSTAEKLLGQICWAAADAELSGHFELATSRSLGARGIVSTAVRHAERAMELAGAGGDAELEASAALHLGDLALDRGELAEARAHAERGLRAGAISVRAPVDELWLLLARVSLRVGDADGAARALAKAGRENHRAQHAILEAILTARSGTPPRATPDVLRLVAKEERWETKARVLAHALSEPALDLTLEVKRRLLDALRALHEGDDVRARLVFRGVPAALVASGHTTSLDADGLMAVATLRREEPPKQLPAALDLLRRKVSSDRVAAIADVGDGLRVVAQSPGSEATRSMSFALELAGRSRLVGNPIQHGPEDEPVPDDGVKRVAVAAAGERGVALYVERPWPLPRFDEREIAFVAALADALTTEARPRSEIRDPTDPESDLGLVGESRVMRELRQEIRALAGYDIPIFLHGESGTGKELVARALHERSPRRSRAFVTLNCAAMTETLIESELFGYVKGAFSGAVSDREGLLQRADGGTLFLDEVAELTPSFQAKLLRVVEQGDFRPVGSTQTRRSDVRFLCATNRSMVAAVREGRFREDLYYRLMSTATIELPPLRERAGDVVLLLSLFVERTASRHKEEPLRLETEALAAVERYRFPGNVRELERLVLGLHARFRGRAVAVADLPSAIRGGTVVARGTLEEGRREFDRRYVRDLLERHAGNRTQAARSAGISRQTLLAMMRRLGESGERSGGAPPESRSLPGLINL